MIEHKEYLRLLNKDNYSEECFHIKLDKQTINNKIRARQINDQIRQNSSYARKLYIENNPDAEIDETEFNQLSQQEQKKWKLSRTNQSGVHSYDYFYKKKTQQDIASEYKPTINNIITKQLPIEITNSQFVKLPANQKKLFKISRTEQTGMQEYEDYYVLK